MNTFRFIDILNLKEPSTSFSICCAIRRFKEKYPHTVTHYIEDTSIAHLMILSDMGTAIMPEFKYQKNEKLKTVLYADYPAISYGIAKQKNDNRTFVNAFIKIARSAFMTRSLQQFNNHIFHMLHFPDLVWNIP